MNTLNTQNSLHSYRNELKEIMSPVIGDKKTDDISSGKDFSNILSDAISSMDQEVSKASANVPKLITGELDNLHTAMIDMSSSQLMLQTAVQVRNKSIEAYNDIKNMQF